MKDASLPITLIVVGLVWLAWHFHFFPDIDWVIALGFTAGGIGVLVIDGINKNSIVTGGDQGRWLRKLHSAMNLQLSQPTSLPLASVPVAATRHGRIVVVSRSRGQVR